MLPVKPGTLFLHVVSWLLFFSLIVSFIALSAHPSSLWWEVLTLPYLLFYLVYTGLFYLNLRVLVPRLYLKRQYVAYVTVTLLLLGAVYLIQPFDRIFRPPSPMHMSPPGVPSSGRILPPPSAGREGGPQQPIDIVSIILFIMIWAVSSALQIMRQWRLTERRAVEAEAGKVRSELSFLKAQIHPHFLFNTLNNIYSLAVAGSDQTPAAILKLSNIMRYLTDEAAHDFVPLDSEIACISDYIDLQRIRLSRNAPVDFAVVGDPTGKVVAPLVMMTFIENVFKYGISIHDPAPILLKIFIDRESLDFFCQNRVFQARADPGRTGIGISNTRQRLEHLYPGRHTLHIVSDESLFTVHLSLRLA